MQLQDFLDGFTRSPLEIALSLGFLLLLLVFFVSVSYLRRRQEQAQIKKRSQKVYQTLLKRHSITADEEVLLSELAAFLRSNERSYMLMENQAIFNACAEKALHTDRLTKAQISALRDKLGFNKRRSGMILESSKQIPVTSPVILLKKPHSPVEGKVLEPTERAFRVQSGTKDMPFPAKSEVEIVYHDATGVYAFSAYLINFSSGVFSLTHSEQLRRVQRREYFRKKISIPCYMHRSGERDQVFPSRFIDLGGGGASVVNPKKAFSAGDDISLSFRSDTETMLHIIGRVVRTSKHNTVLHIDFDNMGESRRDRLYRLLFG
ncbi:PilZ domain-containing protein [Spirochaeta dissipatitropha]